MFGVVGEESKSENNSVVNILITGVHGFVGSNRALWLSTKSC